MADNTDEESLDGPTNTQPDNPSGDIIPTADTETITQNQEIENMEVHHHPDLHHKRKNFREYFLEFLMIFLAVTMGFFAENIREHVTDTARAKVYAQSLYDDIKTDTARIQNVINEKKWIVAKYDSAENILALDKIKENNELLYYIERYVAHSDVFTANDVTYEQLKSSGNFRYVKNLALYKEISDYYNGYIRYQSIDGSFGASERRNEMTSIESRIFNLDDLASLDNMSTGDSARFGFYNLSFRSERKLTPIAGNKEDLNFFYLKIHNANLRSVSAMRFLSRLNNRAEALMTDLKKEYHLQ